MHQAPLFVENMTRYLVEYRGKIKPCWRTSGWWIFDNYHQVEVGKVIVIERIGTPDEVFK